MISIDYIEKNITAIIVIYDVTNEIFECIKNLQNIRKIIVDNGNCDKKIIQQIRKLKNIKYIRSKKNLGFGRANNFGLKYVNTKYTLLINADIKTSINDLVNLVKTLESYPNTAIAVPLLVDEKNKNIDHIEVLPEIADKFHNIKSNENELNKNLLFGDACISFCWAAIMLLKNSVIKKTKLFDKKYFLYWEDYDLCRKLHNLKLPIVKSFASRAYHLKHSSVKDNYINYFIIQMFHVYSSYLYFNLEKNNKILIKRFFIYLFRSFSYLLIFNIRNSIKNLARLTAILKYRFNR